MRTAVSAVLDTQQCVPQNWLGHTLCSHPAYCTTLIEQCVITMKGYYIQWLGNLNNYILNWRQESYIYSCGQNRRWWSLIDTCLTPKYNYNWSVAPQGLLSSSCSKWADYTYNRQWAKPWIDKASIVEREMSRESHNSNTCEDINLIILVDMQSLDPLLFAVFLPNSSTHSLKRRFIYLVGEVDIGSMLH